MRQRALDRVVVGDRHEVHAAALGQLVDLFGRRGAFRQARATAGPRASTAPTPSSGTCMSARLFRSWPQHRPADAAPVKNADTSCDDPVNGACMGRSGIGEPSAACPGRTATSRAIPRRWTSAAPRVEISLRPFALTIRRDGRRLLRALGGWVADGEVRDQFIQLTEGVIAHEELAPARARLSATHAASRARASPRFRLDGGRRAAHVRDRGRRSRAPDAPRRRRPAAAALDWRRRSDEQLVGLGARHGTQFDQAGRVVQLGADRRYTGPDCPAELLAGGGIPQGDCAPVPWLHLQPRLRGVGRDRGQRDPFDLAGERVSVSTRARAGPLRLELFCDPHAGGAAARASAALTGFPACCPSGATGSGRAATSTSTRTTSSTTTRACAGTTSRWTRS